jgi:NhaP-type Na+/H+ or K+/H+ antiporter
MPLLAEPNHVTERLMLAPVAFAGVLTVALASLPAAALRGFLSR